MAGRKMKLGAAVGFIFLPAIFLLSLPSGVYAAFPNRA
jgi:hypothetical protein